MGCDGGGARAWVGLVVLCAVPSVVCTLCVLRRCWLWLVPLFELGGGCSLWVCSIPGCLLGCSCVFQVMVCVCACVWFCVCYVYLLLRGWRLAVGVMAWIGFGGGAFAVFLLSCVCCCGVARWAEQRNYWVLSAKWEGLRTK